jgi:hypothetical protein
MENLKEHSFTFERTCFDITFCTGSGRRTPDLQFPRLAGISEYRIWPLSLSCAFIANQKND